MAATPLIWALALALGGEARVPAAPIREDQHPRYLDLEDRVYLWSELRPVARQTDVMARVRKRRAGRTTLRVLFTSAAVAETWATVQLVERESDWAWVMGAQTGLTALAAGLLWAEIPRTRKIDRAEMLAATNAWLRNHPTAPLP